METVESTLSVPAPEKMAEGWEDELDDNEDNKEGWYFLQSPREDGRAHC